MGGEAPKRIYILDDEPAFCESLQARLQSFGFEAQAFTEGRKCWESLQSAPPNLLILDIRMPEEDGYTFLKRLRSFRDTEDPVKEEAIRSLPVIVATGVGEGMKSLFEQERIAAYVTKPIDSAILRQKIERVLAGSQKS